MHGVVTLFVPHAGISVVPQQVLHTPGEREGGGVRSSRTRADQDDGKRGRGLLSVHVGGGGVVQGAAAALVQLVDAGAGAGQRKHTLVVAVGRCIV